MKRFKKTKKYEVDFPATGYFNWKTAEYICKDDKYYYGTKIIGVLLHDGRFVIEGILWEKEEFRIINENPLDISEHEMKKIQKRINK